MLGNLCKVEEVMFTPIKMLETHWSGLTPCSRASGQLDHWPRLSYTSNCFPLGSEGEASMTGWPLKSTVSPHHMQTVCPGTSRAVSSPVCGGHGHRMGWLAVGSAQGSVTSWPWCTPGLHLHGFLIVAARATASLWPRLHLQPCGSLFLPALDSSVVPQHT